MVPSPVSLRYDPGMSERQKKPSTATWATAAVVAVVLVGVPLVYMTSLGPLVFLRESGAIGQEAVAAIEYPANLVFVTSDATPEWFWENFVAYIQWWQSLAH